MQHAVCSSVCSDESVTNLVPQPEQVRLAPVVEQRPILYEEPDATDHVVQQRDDASPCVHTRAAHVEESEVDA